MSLLPDYGYNVASCLRRLPDTPNTSHSEVFQPKDGFVSLLSEHQAKKLRHMVSFSFVILFISIFSYLFIIYFGMNMPQNECGGQRATCRSHFSPALWALGIKLRSLDLVARAFTVEPSLQSSNSALKLLNKNELGPTVRSSVLLSGEALCRRWSSPSGSAGRYIHWLCMISPQYPHLRTKPTTLTWKAGLPDQLLFGQHFHCLQKERPPKCN